MSLAAGTKLGPYEIQLPLGAGGMGEVYRARDTRLDRTIAIKVLPEHLSDKPEARERFDREARAISSLSHPNICQLYDVGSQNGISYLVMEYLDGETLAERLRRGPLPIAHVLGIGIEICDGLERAHRSGILHRDLKPSNIMLTKSGAKLMDFGLAKPAAMAAGASSSSEWLATISQPLTAEGTIVGTFQYMAPEQVEGKESDARTDIFALGTVLYEMTTGRRAFEGKTPTSTIAAILAAEPPSITSLQPLSPRALETVITACLAKDPEERLQTVHDVKLQLKWIAESARTGGPSGARTSSGISSRIGWLVALLLFVAVIGGVALRWAWWSDISRPMYFVSAVPFLANDVAFAPDGGSLAVVAHAQQTNNFMIWIQPVGGREATVVAGTEDATHPFWSPDGRSIAFFSQGKLKKIDVPSGKVAQILCDAPHGRGGTWNRNGTILFAPEGFGGLYRVSASGGDPTEVTHTDLSRSEFSHRWPVFLPDGKHFLYLAANFSGQFDKNEIYVGSLESTERRPIISASANAAYAEPGYSLFLRDKALVGQRFDQASYKLIGEPHTLVDGVQYLPQIDLAVFDVSGSKALAVQTGKGASKTQLMWFDRSGRILQALGQPTLLGNPALSPDGRRVAIEQTDPDGRHMNIWMQDVHDNTASRLTLGLSLDQRPIWSPDGKRLVFGSNRELHFSLYQKNADGSGTEEKVSDLGGEQQGAWDWSKDSKHLLVMRNRDLWELSLPGWHAQPFLQLNGTIHNAQFSPDGHFVAYSSNETGVWEVYVTPFPVPSSKWQVSRAGGEEPRWRRDGKELFYLSAEGKLMAVPVKTSTTFEAGVPTPLFQLSLHQRISVLEAFSYDVSDDGQRFLVNTRVDEPGATALSMVLNWASELKP